MFKLVIEVCFEDHFGLIRAIFLLLGSTKSVYFFWDTRYNLTFIMLLFITLLNFKEVLFEPIQFLCNV